VKRMVLACALLLLPLAAVAGVTVDGVPCSGNDCAPTPTATPCVCLGPEICTNSDRVACATPTPTVTVTP